MDDEDFFDRDDIELPPLKRKVEEKRPSPKKQASPVKKSKEEVKSAPFKINVNVATKKPQKRYFETSRTSENSTVEKPPATKKRGVKTMTKS